MKSTKKDSPRIYLWTMGIIIIIIVVILLIPNQKQEQEISPLATNAPSSAGYMEADRQIFINPFDPYAWTGAVGNSTPTRTFSAIDADNQVQILDGRNTWSMFM